MGILSIEHSKLAYHADFALYGASVVALAAFLLADAPPQLDLLGLVVAGLASWSAIEYVLHRFVLHSLEPFRRWHAEHHERPTALICAPTLLSATLIGTLVFLPAVLLAGWWPACALTLGVLIGYLGYAITHHALHHWHSNNAWLKRRKRWHALHHHSGQAACYGVTSPLWDHVFGSTYHAPRAAPAAQATWLQRFLSCW
jgi:cyclopropane-fatty-acyl-phospholipid synthase